MEQLLNSFGEVFRGFLHTELREVYAEMMREAEKRADAKMKDSLISVPETRELLRVSDTTLWRWGKSGLLCPVSVGGRKLYRMSDVQRIIKNGEA